MKNIKKSIIVATALLVTSTAFASGHGGFNEYKGCSENKEYKDCSQKRYKHHHKKMRKGHRGDNTRFFIGAVYSLDLSTEQEVKIKNLLKDFEEERFKMFSAFKKDGFDKEAYIQARLDSKEKRIKEKANLIENIYKVLDDKQKVELKEELDDFKKMRKRGKDGSNCNGRR